METHLNISLEGEELEYKIEYSRYRESSSDEAEIIIEGIFLQEDNLLSLFKDEEIELLKDRCERHYQSQMFHSMVERDDRFSSANV